MVWKSTIIDWKEPKSWCTVLSSWIQPHLIKHGLQSLHEMGYQDICWDDSDWLEKLELVMTLDAEDMIETLSGAFMCADVKVYHGCRVDDAGIYYRHGILVNNPDDLANQVRRLVNEEEGIAIFKSRIEQALLEFKYTDRSRGLLYLALDDRILVEMAGQYLLYGSEWILAMIGEGAHEILRKRGIPTLLHVHLPIRQITSGDRTELAKVLLQEWARINVNSPGEVPKKDFAFCLQENVPPEMIVAHSHPAYVHDPYRYGMRWKTEKINCPSCAPHTRP
jgi:hypothetical protein